MSQTQMNKFNPRQYSHSVNGYFTPNSQKSSDWMTGCDSSHGAERMAYTTVC